MKSSWLDNPSLFSWDMPVVGEGLHPAVMRSIHIFILSKVEVNVYWDIGRPLPQYLLSWLKGLYDEI